MTPFPVREIELQVTASNDSEWFKAHHDSGNGASGSRELTFVYYCHREPRPFTGGQLRMYGPVDHADSAAAQRRRARRSRPPQNSIVFFPSHYLHEVTADPLRVGPVRGQPADLQRMAAPMIPDLFPRDHYYCVLDDQPDFLVPSGVLEQAASLRGTPAARGKSAVLAGLVRPAARGSGPGRRRTRHPL